MDEHAFLGDFEAELMPLLDAHEKDNAVLKEECRSYILPALSIYRTMRRYLPDPLASFRGMWLSGARAFYAHRQRKWIRMLKAEKKKSRQ